MNRWLILALSSTLIWVACQQKANLNQGLDMSMSRQKKLGDHFQSIIDSMFEKVPNTKGICMHVEAPDQGVSWSGAIGWANKAANRKLQPNDPAWIASMTKTYMSAAILRLVEDGKLKLDQAISELLPSELLQDLEKAGHQTQLITVAHLNSQTSGIADFTSNELYLKRATTQSDYHWTRQEQIALALSLKPEGEPGEVFSYSDTNNSLLSIILEQLTGLPFQTAFRQLLNFEKLGLKETWFLTLEEHPTHLPPLAHQFATQLNVETATTHPSFDLYGGGGIAATVKDAALFCQAVFTGSCFKQIETKELLFHTIPTHDGNNNDYCMGIAKRQLGQHTVYGHGGFWGTTMQYFPELNASVSIFLMERDEWERYLDILEEVGDLLANSKNAETHQAQAN